MANVEPTAKAGWEVKTLGEVCDILDNQRKPITKRNRVAGPFPYYGATGVLDHVEGFLFDEELVLVGEDGAKWDAGENSAFPISGKCWVNNHAHVLRPNRSEVLDQWLISYLNYSDLSEYITGLTVPKLNQGKLREIPIPCPPLAEQERIVGILDEAFEGISAATAQAEKNLHNARELFQSVLQSTFSPKGGDWVETTLGECIKLKSGDGLTAKNMVKEGDFNVYGGNGVNGRHNKFNFDGEQVIVGRVGAHCGNVHYTNEKIWLTDNAFRVTDCIHDFDFQFLTQVLRVANLRESARQAAQPVISNTSVKDVEISFPKDIPTQQAIVEKLDALSEETKRLEAIYERKKAALSELKQSLLQKAFAGDL